eukprot:4861966-Amphidinium_carterae.1
MSFVFSMSSLCRVTSVCSFQDFFGVISELIVFGSWVCLFCQNEAALDSAKDLIKNSPVYLNAVEAARVAAMGKCKELHTEWSNELFLLTFAQFGQIC